MKGVELLGFVIAVSVSPILDRVLLYPLCFAAYIPVEIECYKQPLTHCMDIVFVASE